MGLEEKLESGLWRKGNLTEDTGREIQVRLTGASWEAGIASRIGRSLPMDTQTLSWYLDP